MFGAKSPHTHPHLTRHLGLIIPLALMILIALFPEFQLQLRYQRTEILAGEWWRLLTGQLTHLGLSHLLLNMAGLALFGALFWRTAPSTVWLLIITLAMPVIALALLWLNPEIGWYLGFSGLLHTLFISALIIELRSERQSTTIPLLILLLIKLVWEQLYGATPGSSALIGGSVVTEAHLYGAVAGLLIGALLPVRYLRHT